MSAGLPGLGLGGLFFIFSALLAPFRELWRTIRGRSRPGEWRIVGRQFAQAVTMVVAIDLTLRLVYGALSLAGAEDVPSAASGTVLPLTLVGITSALLAAVLVATKLAQLGFRLRSAELPSIPEVMPGPAPLRALGFGSAAAVAWVALLSFGASELSPLGTPPESAPSRTAEQDRAMISSPGAPSVRRGGDSFAVASVERPVADPRAVAESDFRGGDGADAGSPSPVPAAPTVSASAPAPSAQVPRGAPVTGQPAGPESASSQPSPGLEPGAPPAPPVRAAPPEGTPAPEHAEPVPKPAPAPEHGGPPEESPAPERAVPGPK